MIVRTGKLRPTGRYGVALTVAAMCLAAMFASFGVTVMSETVATYVTLDDWIAREALPFSLERSEE